MRFADLLHQPYNKNTEIIDLVAIKRALPDTPDQVARQVYADHGRKSTFQSFYAQLEIDQIAWTQVSLSARELVAAAMNPNFKQWFASVSARSSFFVEKGWRCIDVRQEVQEHWEGFGTWLVEPVLLDGQLVRSSSKLHLVEGHTRVGLLKGLTEQSIIEAESMHKVWLGSGRATN